MKQYWKSLNESPEDTPEFASSPQRLGSETEGTDDNSRREFMKLMAASVAMFGGAACSRRPLEKIVSYVHKPENRVTGVPEWYASACGGCDAGCGVLVKTKEGRPIKLEGNPAHPVSQGGLCARGQASILNLYDADRLKGAGASERISEKITAELAALKAKGKKIVILSGGISSPSTNKLVMEFVSSIGAHVTYEPLSSEEMAIANEASFGSGLLAHYHYEKAEVIVTFGADFLGTWGGAVEASKNWSKKRKVAKDMSKLVVFESMMTLTGTNADERNRVRSGDEFKVALVLASELIVNQGKSKFAGNAAVTALLKKYTPQAYASDLDIDPVVFKKLASSLWEKRGRSIILGGGNIVKGEHGVALEVAVNLLNAALENDGATLDFTGAAVKEASSVQTLLALISDMKAGRVGALFVFKSNPVYTLPKSAGFLDALSKVDLVVDFATHLDETAKASNYVLPTHHYLEQWGDTGINGGVYSVLQPTIEPLHDTIGFQDTLIAWGKKLGLAGFSSTTNWVEYLKNNWKHIQKSEGNDKPFAAFWEDVLRDGYFGKLKTENKTRAFNPAALSFIEKMPAITKGLKLVMYAKMGVTDGMTANNGWLQEMPDPVTKITWDNYASVSVAFAKKNGISQGDMLGVKSADFSLALPAHIQPGNHDDTIAVAVGYGRQGAGSVGDGIGFNVYPFAMVRNKVIQMSAIPVTVEKTGQKYKLACTQTHSSIEGRPIIKEATLSDWQKNPKTGNEFKAPLTSLWPSHDYPGYRWAMTVDLNSCTGCGACIIACQAENNIPVVGKKYVLESREMHWIRIDRYYSGRADNPETVHQPMLCQHCENAPCETVCPVLATVHDHEGLNQQIYNRCVGTRYCANNCPYKVRRFNWFTFTEVARPMELAYNPDVTVRTRGVMEKCTFCMQRIRDVKDQAKDENRAVREGEVKTACQQTCPTDAIVFGNINDKDSSVAKQVRDPRAYTLLDDLNVRPSVNYLTKIRNT